MQKVEVPFVARIRDSGGVLDNGTTVELALEGCRRTYGFEFEHFRDVILSWSLADAKSVEEVSVLVRCRKEVGALQKRMDAFLAGGGHGFDDNEFSFLAGSMREVGRHDPR